MYGLFTTQVHELIFTKHTRNLSQERTTRNGFLQPRQLLKCTLSRHTAYIYMCTREVMYRTRILLPDPELPPTTRWEWTKRQEELGEPHWMVLPQAAQNCRGFMSCKCKVGCVKCCNCASVRELPRLQNLEWMVIYWIRWYRKHTDLFFDKSRYFDFWFKLTDYITVASCAGFDTNSMGTTENWGRATKQVIKLVLQGYWNFKYCTKCHITYNF
jgi:hypothetical protein